MWFILGDITIIARLCPSLRDYVDIPDCCLCHHVQLVLRVGEINIWYTVFQRLVLVVYPFIDRLPPAVIRMFRISPINISHERLYQIISLKDGVREPQIWNLNPETTLGALQN